MSFPNENESLQGAEVSRLVQRGAPRAANSQPHADDDGVEAAESRNPLSDWFMKGQELPRLLLVVNTIMLFVIIVVGFVVYNRVQTTLDKVDKMTSTFSLIPAIPK